MSEDPSDVRMDICTHDPSLILRHLVILFVHEIPENIAKYRFFVPLDSNVSTHSPMTEQSI